jgi:hypothetical protein
MLDTIMMKVRIFISFLMGASRKPLDCLMSMVLKLTILLSVDSDASGPATPGKYIDHAGMAGLLKAVRHLLVAISFIQAAVCCDMAMLGAFLSTPARRFPQAAARSR